jgi:mannose PTS system EIIC component
LQAIWLALAGMVVYLDTTAVAQLMISQPLIACPLWGFLVGRPEIGLFFGVTFQLIWLGSLPIGAAKFPEGNLGALVATALAARIAPTPTGEPAWIALAAAAVLGILTAMLGAEVTPKVRRVFATYAPRVVEAAKRGQRLRFTTLFLGAMGIHAAAGFLTALAAYEIGWKLLTIAFGDLAVAGVSVAIVARTNDLAASIWPGLLGAGVAVIVGRFVRRPLAAWFAVVAVVVAAAGWLWL